MADVKVEYGCGCGFETRHLEAATEHSDSTHHKITIRGTIIPIPKPRRNTAEPARTTYTHVSAPEPVPIPEDLSTIDELRQKFSK